jgi:class 3 adenylate cyclase
MATAVQFELPTDACAAKRSIQYLMREICGLAVHIGARIAGLAPARNVLVSQTAKDVADRPVLSQ